MLSWSVLEFGQLMGPEFQHTLESIRWGTGYMLKATSVPDSVVGVVGDPNSDHNCWEGPEDMDTRRPSYVVNKGKPASEVSAEIAAALAASSMVFKDLDKAYSDSLLDRATQISKKDLTMIVLEKEHALFTVITVATRIDTNLKLLHGYARQLRILIIGTMSKNNINSLESNVVIRNVNGSPVASVGGSFAEFGWDAKHAGINILVSQWVMTDPSSSNPFIPKADQFMLHLTESPVLKSVSYSPGGLMFKSEGSNIQHATSISCLFIVYTRYMKAASKVVDCGNNVHVTPTSLVNFTRTLVDYILGSNPSGMSYMVGFGQNYPKKIHHRGSVLPSMDQHPQHIDCNAGYSYFHGNDPNQNDLTGAVVGGPGEDDKYEDSRIDATKSEPTTYINAPFVGVLAYFKALYHLTK
ncbi:unnamed protein product [Malus baccata var. baccata]